MKTINIFLGGGVQLLHGDERFRGYRNEVIDPVIGQLNAIEGASYFYITKDYSDLTRNVVKGKQQDVYNRYIVEEAHVAIFIIDGALGNLTRHEIDCAVESTKKKRHPIVYIYGKDVSDDDEVVQYLNQEGIYYQHFYDNRDLSAKIKADLQTAVTKVGAKRRKKLLLGVAALALIGLAVPGVIYLTGNSAGKTIDDCSLQLYLMRYKDVNSLTDNIKLTPEMLAQFKYEDSIKGRSDIQIYPVLSSDSVIHTSCPYLRVKLHNKNRNTVVFVEGELEVDSLTQDTTRYRQVFEPVANEDSEVSCVDISGDRRTYVLKGFRQNVAYGETDDRYFFRLKSAQNCSFRMRMRARTQNGECLYSNYVYVNYIR